MQESEMLRGDYLSDDERAKLAALKRKSRVEEKQNIVQSVLSELQFIEWPAPRQAAVDTAVVMAIVVGSSVFLFAVNSLLTEAAKLLF
jgi:preprotein translocase SecE subunit